MTMQNPNHPPEERLAALAGDDPEATRDAGLREHLETCLSCGDLVAELRILRVALAELPDLAPSRWLQLVPPMPTVPERRGWLATLRGIAAPIMAAGAGLAIVGAMGLGGLAAGGIATGGAAPVQLDEATGRGAMEGESAAPNDYGLDAASPIASTTSEADESGDSATAALTDTSTPLPWLVLLAGGGALLVGGLVLRFVVNPRAG